MNIILNEPYFGHQVKLSNNTTSPRELCKNLLFHEEHPNYLYPGYVFAKDLLDKASIPTKVLNAVENNIFNENIINTLIKNTNKNRYKNINSPINSIQYEKLLIEFFPFEIINGAWLQGSTSLAIAETKLGVSLQKQYKIRTESPLYATNGNISNNYENIFNNIDYPQYKPDDESFFLDKNISDNSFEHALFSISLGLFSQTFMPEILGYNLWQSLIGPCPIIKEISGQQVELNTSITNNEFSDKNYFLKNASKESIYLYLSTTPTESKDIIYRIIRGFFACEESYLQWEKSILPYISDDSMTKFMVDILESKKKYITGYHKKISIDGININDYFSSQNKILDLLQALQTSPYINPGDSSNSRLLTHSLAFEGAMFGVFTKKEIKVIKQWIDSLSNTTKQEFKNVELKGKYIRPHDHKSFELESRNEFSKYKNSELCYYLTNIDLFPIARPFSFDLANQSSQKNRRMLKIEQCPEYSPQKITEIIDKIRKEQANDYAKNTTKPLTKEEIINQTTAPNPGFCLDGCWLQGLANITRLHNEENKLLFDIYIDENGDGEWIQNHNKIARDLLQSMGKTLPPVTSPDFFKIGEEAVFGGINSQLSWTLNSKYFMPEILGLNVFIESLHVGNGFRKRADENKAAGFDPLYFKVHESVDNFSTGHTAMSVRAIISYFDKINKTYPSLTQELWERTWSTFKYNKLLMEELNCSTEII